MRSLAAALLLLAAPTALALGPWQATTALPMARFGFSAAAMGGHLYVTGDGTGNVYVATPATDGSLGAWSQATQLPAALLNTTLVSDGTRLYAIGGTSNSVCSGATFIGFGTGTAITWTNGPALPSARELVAAVAAPGGIYAAGGDPCKQSAPLADVLYLPVGGSWSAAGQLATARTLAGIGRVSGALGVAGGFDGASPLASIEGFSEAGPGMLSGPQPAGNLPAPLFAFGYAQAGSELYVVGGGDGASLSAAVEIATFGTGVSFAPGPALPAPRVGVAAAVSGNFLYAIGGADQNGAPVADVDYAQLAGAPPPDAGAPDSGPAADAGATADAGAGADAGWDGGTCRSVDAGGGGHCATGGGAPPPGCGCGVAGSGLLALLALGALKRRRTRG